MKIPILFFVTAVISCQKLLTADKNENQPRVLKFGTPINFSAYMKITVNFFFISAVNSWRQLIKVDENENQLRELKSGIHIT